MTEYERHPQEPTQPDPSPWAPPPPVNPGQAVPPPPPPPGPGPSYGPGVPPGPDLPYGPMMAPGPGYPGQPAWGPPGPAPGRSGSRTVSVLMVLGLMVFSALGGGAFGAWVYAQSDDDTGGTAAGGTRVVDAPQLDYTSLASIASEVGPSVVQIQAGDGSGSGVTMSDGYVLTNAHVVEIARSDQVTLRFSNGETEQATVVGADERTDIAVVQVDGGADLTPAAFGDSEQVLVGDTVLAIGSPLGFQGSVTQGIVSARDRTLPVGERDQRRSLSGLLQTDASINPGNSGGPLVNLAGEVIGINTAIATDGDTGGFQGLGFAVPSNRATEVADQLISGGDVSHAFLGVSVNTVDTSGALIIEITPGSPADEAGLREGDIIVRAGEQPVTDASDIVNAVQTSEPGDTLEIEFERDGSRQTTTVTLAEADD